MLTDAEIERIASSVAAKIRREFGLPSPALSQADQLIEMARTNPTQSIDEAKKIFALGRSKK